MRALFSIAAVAGVLAANVAAACEYTKARTAAAPMTAKPVAEAPATPKSGG
ncbi:MAG: hypothetical protein IT561_06840 [Alphaproteobacteria bacterium]|nr:hypothetical protein [Alphaproteobacteria bacterium]